MSKFQELKQYVSDSLFKSKSERRIDRIHKDMETMLSTPNNYNKYINLSSRKIQLNNEVNNYTQKANSALAKIYNIETTSIKRLPSQNDNISIGAHTMLGAAIGQTVNPDPSSILIGGALGGAIGYINNKLAQNGVGKAVINKIRCKYLAHRYDKCSAENRWRRLEIKYINNELDKILEETYM